MKSIFALLVVASLLTSCALGPPPSAPLASAPPTGPVPLTAKSFGARGDGVTDDTAAIQAAMDATSNGLTNALYFPPGIYRLSATLNHKGNIWGHNPIFPSDSGVRLLGAGMDRTQLVWTKSGIGLAFTNKLSGYDGVTIANMALVGPSIGTPDSIGLAFGGFGPELGYNAAVVTVDHVAFYNWGIGAASTNVWSYVFQSCEVYSNSVEGLSFAGCHSVNIINTFVKGGWLVPCGIGIGFHTPLNMGSGDNALIQGCTIFDQRIGILNNDLALTVVSGHLEGCGIYLESTNAVGTELIGCYILDYPRAWAAGCPALISANAQAMPLVIVMGDAFDTQNTTRPWFDCAGCATNGPHPIVIGNYTPIELFSGASPTVLNK